MRGFMKKIFEKIRNVFQKGENVVLCSIVESGGSVPRGIGAKMAVFEDGSIAGTVGGGELEYRCIAMARERIFAKGDFLYDYELNNIQAATEGMVCGGRVKLFMQTLTHDDENIREAVRHICGLLANTEAAWLITVTGGSCSGIAGTYCESEGLISFDDSCIGKEAVCMGCFRRVPVYCSEESLYIEPLVSGGTVYVFGGGTVSRELVPVLTHLDFRTVVCEDRESFVTAERFPDAAERHTGDFSVMPGMFNIKEDDYIVIMTRGHQADFEVLCQALRTRAFYIGVIGSRRKMAYTFERLRAEGFGEDELGRIHTPIGIAIKAETPAEIAISVAAELIMCRADFRQK